MKTLAGTVTNNQSTKTITVTIETRWRHPKYKKIIKKTKKYLVHDEHNSQLGQTVTIAQTRPISKRKTWKVVRTKPQAASKQPKAILKKTSPKSTKSQSAGKPKKS